MISIEQIVHLILRFNSTVGAVLGFIVILSGYLAKDHMKFKITGLVISLSLAIYLVLVDASSSSDDLRKALSSFFLFALFTVPMVLLLIQRKTTSNRSG